MSRRFVFFTPFVLALALAPPTLGQENRASMSGLITDPTGVAVPNASVRAVSVERGTSLGAGSNESGRYLIGLRLESYNITDMPWFSTNAATNLSVTSLAFGQLSLGSNNAARSFSLGGRLIW